jgi:hypothetical protein
LGFPTGWLSARIKPNLSGGVEGIDYIIAYGGGEGTEEEADN